MFGFTLVHGPLGATLKKVLQYSEAQLADAAKAAMELETMRRELSKLRAEKDEQLEKYARREREIEHMLGLERERQKFETDAAKREAVLAVREEGLKSDRERFEGQMEFHERRFTEEVRYLKDMIDTLAKQLPTAHFERLEMK